MQLQQHKGGARERPKLRVKHFGKSSAEGRINCYQTSYICGQFYAKVT